MKYATGKGRAVGGLVVLSAGLSVFTFVPEAFGIAYVTNDVYTVTSYELSTERQQLNMFGGVVDFRNTGSGGCVRNVIRIDSAENVEFVSTNAATPRPIVFVKDVFNPGGGRLVLSESAFFGSINNYNPYPEQGRDMLFGPDPGRKAGGTGFPYLAPDAITFKNPDDTLVLTGRVALTAWPTFRYAMAETGYFMPGLYGADMITDEMISDGCFTVPWKSFLWAEPRALPADVKLVIPSDKSVDVIHGELDVETGSLSYPSAAADNVYSNDIDVSGVLLVKAMRETTFLGDIAGPEEGRVNVQASSPECIRRFSGDLSRFHGWLRVYSGSGESWMDGRMTRCYLDQNAPAGGIRLFASSNATTRCAFYPEEAAARKGDWSLTQLRADGVYETDAFGLQGANWLMLSGQHLTIDLLGAESADSGGLIVTGPTATENSATLTVNRILKNHEIVIENGLPLTIGALEENVKIRYAGGQVNTNAVNLASGCVLEELETPDGETVFLNGGAVENVTGNGTLVVTGGDVRLGSVAATVSVQVRGGTVTFGSGADLSSVLGARPALWLDASDTEKMTGAYNAGWAAASATAEILEAHPLVQFNGAATATWTNEFPLIEKWFDKRPEQTYNYGWQDRCVNYKTTLYTLVYPYLVPGGLNGKAYMSFGVHGETDLPASAGTSRAVGSTNCRRERRRMPIMHDMEGTEPRGNAINARATVLVFGSQQGGGRAVLGSYNGNDRADWLTSGTNPACGANYARGGEGYGAENPLLIATTKKSAWIDGERVDPAVTGLNGGWQIISITNAPAYWRSLGESASSGAAAYSGGQNYAEVISFTNAITDAERRAVEGYLALKWGLVNALPVKGRVSVAAGATVKGAVANVTGDGTWELDLPETTFTLDASFSGVLAGGGLITVPDVAGIPSLDAAFDGTLNVTGGGTLAFSYANGGFTPALVAPDAELAFPAALTVSVSVPEDLPLGDYTLVEGRTLTGLTSCELANEEFGSRRGRLVRGADSLVLRVVERGLSVVFR